MCPEQREKYEDFCHGSKLFYTSSKKNMRHITGNTSIALLILLCKLLFLKWSHYHG